MGERARHRHRRKAGRKVDTALQQRVLRVQASYRT
jgi:hypothetical protein